MNFIIFVAALLTNVGGVEPACAAVLMDCSYNSRYDLIDQIYEVSGQIMFDQRSNPYYRDEPLQALEQFNEDNPPRWYIGTKEQNLKLARNILANAHLFRDGILTEEAARNWKVVN